MGEGERGQSIKKKIYNRQRHCAGQDTAKRCSSMKKVKGGTYGVPRYHAQL